MARPTSHHRAALTLGCLLAHAAAARSHFGPTFGFHADEFTLVGPTAPDAEVGPWTVALPSRDADAVQAALHQRSTPSHPLYGAWLSRNEVLALGHAPVDTVRAAVAAHHAAAGAVCTHSVTSLRCTATAGVVNQLYNTTIHEYAQLAPDGSVLRHLHRVPPAVDGALPLELAGSVSFVSGLADFPSRRHRMGVMRHAAPTVVGGNNGRRLQTNKYVTLESLSHLYNTTAFAGNSISTSAAVQFDDAKAVLASDITEFASLSGVPSWTIGFKYGPFSGEATESLLDAQYLGGVGSGNTQQWWTMASTSAFVYEWSEAVLANATIADVFSISWAADEASSGSAYVANSNANFAALGLLGATIVVASGDWGAHGTADTSCAHQQTYPGFPASSPNVVSVGATMFTSEVAIASPTSSFCVSDVSCVGSGTEITASIGSGALITSGGGFSVFSTQPTWQAAAVNAYLGLSGVLPPAGTFTSTGRGFPDVALAGHNIPIILDSGKEYEAVDGTSCSAPIMGGILAVANAQRLLLGRPALGFVTPALYSLYASTPAIFHDIGKGGNNSCTETVCDCTGFSTAAGWDAVTGLGSVNAGLLQAALIALGATSPSATAAASLTPVSTPTPSPTATSSASPTGTPSWSRTGTPSSSQSGTSSWSSTGSASYGAPSTPSSSLTGTPSSSSTGTPSASSTGTPSSSHTGTPSSSRTGTPSSSRTHTPSSSHTGTPSFSRTGTSSSSHSGTASSSHTHTPSSSHTGTASPTHTGTATSTRTTTVTGTITSSRTASGTGTPTPTSTSTGTKLSSSSTGTRTSSSTGTASRTPSRTR